MVASVKVFFEPKSVAIVGASDSPMKLGYYPLSNLLNLGFKGELYAVNPKYKSISGLRCYRSVSEIPGEVDLAVVIVPNVSVPSVIRECAEKGVKGAAILSSGFRESGEKGAELEEDVLNTARKAGMRIIGPNTTGTINTSNNFTTTFVPLNELNRGQLSFVAQTGLFAGATIKWILTSQKYGIAKVFGLGNKCDVDETEAIEYLAEDPDTKVIVMYLEGLKDGRKFFEKAKEVTEKKPIVLLKTGRTEAGVRAACSHTGSLAVRGDVFNAVCRQAGIIPVNDFDEMLDVAKALVFQPFPRGNRVGVVSMTGGGGVAAVDACVEHGLKIAQLSNKTMDSIRSMLPGWASLGNYLDLEPLFEGVGFDCYDVALEACLGDENVDCLLLVLITMASWFLSKELRKTIMNALVRTFEEKKRKYPEKPMVIHIIDERDVVEEMKDSLERIGIPVYPSVGRCAKVLSVLTGYMNYLRKKSVL